MGRGRGELGEGWEGEREGTRGGKGFGTLCKMEVDTKVYTHKNVVNIFDRTMDPEPFQPIRILNKCSIVEPRFLSLGS